MMISSVLRFLPASFSNFTTIFHLLLSRASGNRSSQALLSLVGITLLSFCVPYSTVSADEVPAECAELYIANGAVPNSSSCVYLASTISVGLGNFYCRTFAADTIDDFCGDTQNKEWVDLTDVETNSEIEDVTGSNGAGFAHQFYCIADKSCTDFDANGDRSWATGFVKHLFDRMMGESDLPESLQIECWDWMSDDMCFKWKGYRAHSFELLDGFFTYCDLVRTNVDYDRWDQDHNTFLQQGVTTCLNEVMATDNLGFIDASSITGKAADLRELAQKTCRIQNFIRSGGGVVGDDTVFNRVLQKAIVDVVVPNSLRIPDPEKEDFYDTYWDTIGSLDVTVSDDTFFVRPGEQVTLSASRASPDGGTTEIINPDEILFELMTNERHVDLTQNGVLTVNSAASPFSIQSDSGVVLVVASAGNERGIAQIMIRDEDTDGDTLVDSYEDEAGFNKAVPDDLQLDSDNDGISDLEQILSETKTAIEQSNSQLNESVTGGGAFVNESGNGTNQLDDDPAAQVPSSSSTSGGGSISIWVLLMLLMRSAFASIGSTIRPHVTK